MFLLYWPTQHLASPVKVAWFCLQHQHVKAMDHIRPKQTTTILFPYLPVSLEDQGGSILAILAMTPKGKIALEASGKTFSLLR